MLTNGEQKFIRFHKGSSAVSERDKRAAVTGELIRCYDNSNNSESMKASVVTALLEFNAIGYKKSTLTSAIYQSSVARPQLMQLILGNPSSLVNELTNLDNPGSEIPE